MTNLFDLLFGQAAGGGNLDGLLLAGSQILGRDMDDPVGIDIEGDLDLRQTPGSRRNAGQLETAEGLVISRHLPLALKDMDGNGRLIVGGGGKDLAFLGRDGGIFLDQLGHDTAQGLYPQGKRSHVEKQNIFDVTF